jgi:hypothetical protein
MATKAKAKKPTATTKAPNKTAQVITMLKRGTTREAVLKATGWPSISMQAVAKRANLKLKVDESKWPFVYRT